MIKHGLKAVLGTDHGRWGIGTVFVIALFLTGYEMISILLAVYNQIFFIGYAVDAATAGNKKSVKEAAVESQMEEAMDMVGSMMGGMNQNQNNGKEDEN